MILGHDIVKVLRARLTQGCGAQVAMNILEHGIKVEAKRRKHVCGPMIPGLSVWERNLNLHPSTC